MNPGSEYEGCQRSTIRNNQFTKGAAITEKGSGTSNSRTPSGNQYCPSCSQTYGRPQLRQRVPLVSVAVKTRHGARVGGRRSKNFSQAAKVKPEGVASDAFLPEDVLQV